MLVVRKVFLEEKTAECIYAWGPYRDRESGFIRVFAKLVPDSKPEIKFWKKRRKFNFTLKGKLVHGVREYRGRVNKIRMEKTE